MTNPRHATSLFTLAIVTTIVASVGIRSVDAAPITVGDANGGGTQVDTANQTRLNIELDPINLTGGTYDVLQFAADTDGTGFITPLLLQRNVPNNGYEVVWTGADIGVTGTANPNVSTTNYTPGDEQFILTLATDIYVGAWHDGDARVQWANGGSTDHDGGDPQTPTSFFVGQNILDSDISNSGLGRTYMIEATIDTAVTAVPEPASVVLWVFIGLGLVGFSAGRRRLKK